ncbi:DeoR/GlpR family DNA-binding transcription regulator [Suttonella ornithocola]|uniref:Glycerol-3-phosphate regulon repressor n=1 Tax=Suttonella ornithocola TaxID=279832 RepID=A0A380MLR0_9GAMM|nr:DeoR/GlpR family DNA-binding transcription regulator [Suttonella ornithocola]SUO93575.1 Glycerol-3-phosphate regulon repressor [Suttonella ornithocola]
METQFTFRQKQIIDLIKIEKRIRAKVLAEQFFVSELTIRRDLDILQDAGLIRRFHGGAEYLPPNEQEINKEINQRKLAIAKAAANAVQDSETLFVNSSSTALLTLAQIKYKHLTVITNNCKALSLEVDARVKLVLCGGDISFPKEALTGEFALSSLNMVTASKAIMGVSGLSLETGMTTATLAEIAVNEKMLARTSGERIIVAESYKLGHNSTFVSGRISDFDTLYTDSDADKNFIQQLREQGINVVLVPYS